MKAFVVAILLICVVSLHGQDNPAEIKKASPPKVVYAQLTVVMKMTRLGFDLEVGFDQGNYKILKEYLDKCITTSDALTLLGQNGWEVVEYELKVGTSSRDQYFILKKDYSVYPAESNGGISSPP